MNCKYCGRRVVLHPSAEERAAKYGGRPSDYTRRFTYHSYCHIAAYYGRPNPVTGEVYTETSKQAKP